MSPSPMSVLPPARSAPAGIDTTDMVVVHRVFRREFGLLPAMVAAVAPADTDRSALIGAHAREMVDVLRHHHHGEDELVWPRLLAQPGRERLVDRMERQHERLAVLLAATDDMLARWVTTAVGVTRDRLVSSLGEMHRVLEEHLTDEENHALPVIAAILTSGEWAELGRRGMASMPRARLIVFLGHILADADPDERVAFLRHVPLPGRLAYRLVGARRFAAETRDQRRDLAVTGDLDFVEVPDVRGAA
jgi:hemerythrin-like domain-containing protein